MESQERSYNMLFASTSALVARFVTHPLDSIKTLTQYSSRNQNYSLPRKFASYWKGLSASLLFSVPATAVYLTCYDEAKVFFAGNNSPDSLGVHVLAAASAELSSAVFWTPMNRNWGVWGLAKHIVQTEGARGLFRGYVLTQAVYVPYTVVYFVSYERFKTAWAGIRGYMGTMDYLLCSTASASLAGAVSNVLDVVKTRVQVDSRPAFAVIADMYRKDGGLMAFSRGMGARILWVAPSMAISITVYETLKDIRQARISKAK